MPKKVFTQSEYKEEALQRLRDGGSEADIRAEFPISPRTAKRYAQEIQDEKAVKLPESQTKQTVQTGQREVTKPQSLVTVTSKQPSPIVFRMGDLTIDLNPAHLYDAYRYYEDIKRIDPSIDDDFSTMVKAACKHAWEIFSEREAERAGVRIEIAEEVRD